MKSKIKFSSLIAACLGFTLCINFSYGQRGYYYYFESGMDSLQFGDRLYESDNYKIKKDYNTIAKTLNAYEGALRNFNAADKSEDKPENAIVENKINDVRKKINIVDSDLNLLIVSQEMNDLSNKVLNFADEAISNEQYREGLLLSYKALEIFPKDQNSNYQQRKFGDAVFYHTQQLLNEKDLPVSVVKISPVEDLMAIIQGNNGILLKHLQNPISKRFSSGQDYILDLAFSRNGERFATVAKNGTMVIWTKTGDEVKRIKAHNSPIHCVSFSKDGQFILTGSRDNSIKIWTVEGLIFKELKEHFGPVYEAVFSEDGQWVLSRSSDNTARSWKFRTNPSISNQYNLGNKYLYDVDISVENNALVIGGHSPTIRFWNLQDNKLKEEFTGSFEGVQFLDLFKSGYKILAVGLRNKIWIIDTDRPASHSIDFNLTGNVRAAAVAPNERELLFGFSEGKAELTDLFGNTLMMIRPGNKKNSVKEVLFNREGTFLIILYEDGRLIQCKHPQVVKKDIENGLIKRLTSDELKQLGIYELYRDIERRKSFK